MSGLPVKVRRNAAARRLVMRLAPAGDEVRVTVPKRASLRQIRSFVEAQQGWVAGQLARQPQAAELSPGAEIMLFGQLCRLLHEPGRRGADYSGTTLVVGGAEVYFARRVTDWVKQESKHWFAREAMELAAELGCVPAAVTVRDTGSRWGSCSRDRKLSLSWRLAFAPARVATYVIAHEVAHLKHFDHSPAFWQAVGVLVPDYAEAKNWLRRHGGSLHRVG